MPTYRYITGMSALCFYLEGDSTARDFCDDAKALSNLHYESTQQLHGIIKVPKYELPNGEVLTDVYVATHHRAVTDLFWSLLNTKHRRKLIGLVDEYLTIDIEQVITYMFGLVPKTKADSEILAGELGYLHYYGVVKPLPPKERLHLIREVIKCVRKLLRVLRARIQRVQEVHVEEGCEAAKEGGTSTRKETNGSSKIGSRLLSRYRRCKQFCAQKLQRKGSITDA